MNPDNYSSHLRTATRLAIGTVVAMLVYFCAISAQAQSFSSAAGLLQGERIARVTTMYDDTLSSASDTTMWIPFGTHIANLASERTYAPTRFTVFAKLDTLGISTPADPELTLRAQIALNDTTIAYEQGDNSLILATSLEPITEVANGVVFPVPVYGGGWIRFIVSMNNNARLRLYLWRVR